MSCNNSNVAHVWAQQNGSEARNGKNNFYTRGRSLYSYNTEIARFIDGRAVYTSHRYSATTTGKHLIHVPRALPDNVESYRTAYTMRTIPDSWEHAAPFLFWEMLTNIKTAIESMRRSRSYVADQAVRIVEQCHDAIRFYNNYIVNNPNGGAPRGFDYNGAITIEDLQAMTSIAVDSATVYRERFGIDMSEKYAQARAHEERQNAKRERERAQWEARRAFEAKKQEEKIAEWRAGTYSGTLYGLPVMLRLNGAIVETSHGARVPLVAARLMYSALLHGENIIGKQIGDFTIRSVDSEKIVIGCHTIPMMEVHAILDQGADNSAVLH